MKSTKEDEKPSFPFYPKDWMTDAGLIISDPEEKGIWIDMLCYMYFSPIRGAMLNPDGSKMDNKTIAKLLRVSETVITNAINKLITNKVARVLENGTIINLRMYQKDKDLSQKRREAGLKGMEERWKEKKDNKAITSPITNLNKDNLSLSSSFSFASSLKEKDIKDIAGSPKTEPVLLSPDKPKKERKKKEANPEIKEAVDYFHNHFLKKYGEKYAWDFPKDYTLFESMLKIAHSKEKLCTAIDNFFTSKDPFYQKKHTVGFLKGCLPALLVSAISPIDGKPLTGDY